MEHWKGTEIHLDIFPGIFFNFLKLCEIRFLTVRKHILGFTSDVVILRPLGRVGIKFYERARGFASCSGLFLGFASHPASV